METTQTRAGRSPSYPDLDLEEALQKAQVLWEKENRNFAPVAAIQQHWGYKANTGPGLRAVAALKKFGLLVDTGSSHNRQARLTELAFSIVLDQRADSAERAAAIREAALFPPIHASLWEEYKDGLPSDETLRFVLQRDRKFSPKGADALIKEFRSTIEFAKLQEGADIAESVEAAERQSDRSGDDGESSDPFAPSPSPFEERSASAVINTAQTRTLQVPLLGDTWAALQLPHPMSEAEWKQMMTVLEAMKPGIVSGTKGTTETYDSEKVETSSHQDSP